MAKFVESKEEKTEATTTATTLEPKTFYCMRGEYTFVISELETDAFGDIEKNAAGKPKHKFTQDADGNNKVAVTRTIKFERMPIKDPKTGKTSAIHHVGRLIVQGNDARRDDILAVIAQAMKNRYNEILTEDEYKQQHNPEAYGFEKEKLALKTDNEALKKRNEMLEKTLREKGVLIEG